MTYVCFDMAVKDTKHEVSVQLVAYLESVPSIFFEDMIFVLASDWEMVTCSCVGDALIALIALCA